MNETLSTTQMVLKLYLLIEEAIRNSCLGRVQIQPFLQL